MISMTITFRLLSVSGKRPHFRQHLHLLPQRFRLPALPNSGAQQNSLLRMQQPNSQNLSVLNVPHTRMCEASWAACLAAPTVRVVLHQLMRQNDSRRLQNGKRPRELPRFLHDLSLEVLRTHHHRHHHQARSVLHPGTTLDSKYSINTCSRVKGVCSTPSGRHGGASMQDSAREVSCCCA